MGLTASNGLFTGYRALWGVLQGFCLFNRQQWGLFSKEFSQESSFFSGSSPLLPCFIYKHPLESESGIQLDLAVVGMRHCPCLFFQ